MEKTTIAIDKKLKEQIDKLGYKGETYSEILLRLIEIAKKKQLQELLMNEAGTISIEEALSNAKKQWQG